MIVKGKNVLLFPRVGRILSPAFAMPGRARLEGKASKNGTECKYRGHSDCRSVVATPSYLPPRLSATATNRNWGKTISENGSYD